MIICGNSIMFRFVVIRVMRKLVRLSCLFLSGAKFIRRYVRSRCLPSIKSCRHSRNGALVNLLRCMSVPLVNGRLVVSSVLRGLL